MRIGESHHDDVVIHRGIDHRIGKRLELALPQVAAERVPPIGESFDQSDSHDKLVKQATPSESLMAL